MELRDSHDCTSGSVARDTFFKQLAKAWLMILSLKKRLNLAGGSRNKEVPQPSKVIDTKPRGFVFKEVGNGITDLSQIVFSFGENPGENTISFRVEILAGGMRLLWFHASLPMLGIEFIPRSASQSRSTRCFHLVVAVTCTSTVGRWVGVLTLGVLMGGIGLRPARRSQGIHHGIVPPAQHLVCVFPCHHHYPLLGTASNLGASVNLTARIASRKSPNQIPPWASLRNPTCTPGNNAVLAHGKHLQTLRRELQEPVPPRSHCRRGPADCQRGANVKNATDHLRY